MSVKVNKKSVKQQGGSMMQPVQQPVQQQIDPAIQEIATLFTTSIEEGQKAEDVIMGLMTQEVDQTIIVQALMGIGYEEEDITQLFESVALLAQKKPANATEVNNNPQELSRNQELAENNPGGPIEVETIDMVEAKSGIEIKKKNRGKFTKWAKARGMAVQEAARKVLANKDRYPPSVVKMANFAKNAAGWNKAEDGGDVSDYTEGVRQREGSYNPPNRKYTLDPRFREVGGEETVTKGTDISNNINQFMNAVNTKVIDQDNNLLFGTNETIDNDASSTIQPGPLYFNPNQFKTGNNFSLGKTANVLMEGYDDMFSGKDEDGDGLKDGSFLDWNNKKNVNTFNKYANADYTIDMDLSDDNQLAANNWYNQFIKENPEIDDQFDEVGNLISTGLEGVNINKPILTEVVEKGSKWINKNLTDLSGVALKTYNALKEKLNEKPLGGSIPKFQGLNQSEVLNLDDETKKEKKNRIKNYTHPYLQQYYEEFARNGITNEKDIRNILSSMNVLENDTSFINQSMNRNAVRSMGNMDVNQYIGSEMYDDGSGNWSGSIGYDDKQKYFTTEQDEDGLSWDFLTNIFNNDSNNYTGVLKSRQTQKYGGSLPKAQYSIPDSGAPFANPIEDANETETLTFQDWVLQDPITRSSANAQQEYQAYVASETASTPTASTPSADQLWGEINMPEVDVNFGGLQGFVDRTMNSNVVQAFDDVSNFAVKGADVVNDWFEDKAINDAEIENRNKLVADNIYSTETDPFNSRGMWDINSGRAGSEGDRTTGLYMTKKGGEKKTKNVVNVDSAMLAKLIAAGADIEML